MAVATINLTLDSEILEKIDMFAQSESRTRLDLIYSSIQLYLEQKQKLQELFEYGESVAKKYNLTKEDVINEINDYRNGK
jgi:predicted transcriptional regulator